MKKSKIRSKMVQDLKRKVNTGIIMKVNSLGMQQQDFAKQVGIHRAQACRILNGHIEAYSLHKLIEIAEQIGISVEAKVIVRL